MQNIDDKSGIKTEKTQSYYEGRMLYLIEFAKDEGVYLINKNRNIVIKMISEYKEKFSQKPNYDRMSVDILENFILN